jgi:uncharacterized protein (TIGR03435 family)
MKTISAAVVFSGWSWLALSAQTPIATSVDMAFEVASIKPNKSGATNSSTSGRAGSFSASNVTARELIIYAYRLRPFQLAGGPGWIGSDRFDIQARPPENANDNRAMTRALLRDRFKLVAHTETRQEQVYALVLARPDGGPGPQLKASTQNCATSQPGAASPCGINTSVNDTTGRMTGTGQSMEGLVNALGGFGLSRMVLDRTGLKGQFDFELRWTPDNLRAPAGQAQANDAPSIFAALQEQLGLRLESQRGPVEFLVVDRIEQPTPD